MLLQVALTIIIGYVTLKILKYFKLVSSVSNWPGIRQPFSPASPIVQLGLIPEWLAPHQRGFLAENNWTKLYKPTGKDVLTSISPDHMQFIVADANVAKEITTTRVQHFPKPIHQYGVVNVFGLNVVSTEAEIWKRHRKIAAVGFTERNNKLVFQETVKFANSMSKELIEMHKTSGNATIDVVSYALKIALCVISSASFGIDTEWDHSDKIEPGHKMTFFESLEEITTRPLPLIILPRWALNLPIFNLPRLRDAIKEYSSYITERIRMGRDEKDVDRSKLDDRRGDLFSVLIRTADGQKGADLTLSDEELAGNIYILMLAGHETTAHTLSFALGLLALHPEVQEELYQEVKKVVGNKDKLEYDDLINLKYGLAVMNETLRLYPIVSAVPKWAPEATTMDDGKIHVPAGSYLTLHVTALHTNEKYWGSDALKFRPSRFLEDYNKDAFIPFSDGSRSCLGKRFAQIEAVSVLAVLVKNFIISSEVKDEKTLLEPTTVLTLVPKNKVNLKFTPRANIA